MVKHLYGYNFINQGNQFNLINVLKHKHLEDQDLYLEDLEDFVVPIFLTPGGSRSGVFDHVISQLHRLKGVVTTP